MATVILKKCSLTAKQKQYVMDNYNHMTIEEMARNLNLNFMKVGRNMRVLGLEATIRARPKTKVIEMDTKGFFNVDKYAKKYAI